MFKTYNPDEPLFFLHIPKCAGQSLEVVLRTWFHKKYVRHNFQTESSQPQTASVSPSAGMCIGGHFSRKKGRSVLDVYPESRQFFTFLRDPWEAALSNYFYWKSKMRQNNIDQGKLKPGSHYDFKDLTDYLGKTQSFLLNFFPEKITPGNYRGITTKWFVYIGILEHFQRSLDQLADRIGKNRMTVPHENASMRDETAQEEAHQLFIAKHPLEYEVYSYIREKCLDQG